MKVWWWERRSQEVAPEILGAKACIAVSDSEKTAGATTPDPTSGITIHLVINEVEAMVKVLLQSWLTGGRW